MTALLLALLSLAPGDVTVCRSIKIDSERPIAVIVMEGAWGYVARPGPGLVADGVAEEGIYAQAFSAIFHDGWQPVLKRAWHVLGFVLWDRAGTVEYAYGFDAGGIHVDRWARISNGSVQTTATLTGDLGERRLRSVTLSVEAKENGTTRGTSVAGSNCGNLQSVLVRRPVKRSGTQIELRLSAEVACGRLGARIVDRVAGRKLCEQLADLEAAGRAAVRDGESEINAMIRRFIERRAKR